MIDYLNKLYHDEQFMLEFRDWCEENQHELEPAARYVMEKKVFLNQDVRHLGRIGEVDLIFPSEIADPDNNIVNSLLIDRVIVLEKERDLSPLDEMYLDKLAEYAGKNFHRAYYGNATRALSGLLGLLKLHKLA
jgi:hypothetical protein